MVFKGEKYTLHISEHVQSVFNKYIQDDKYKNEAGGILMGQIKGKNVYLIKVSVPNEFDKSTRFSFERDKRIAQIIADYEFINSGNKTIYIGEWHTHPEDHPEPSGQDKNMIKDQLKLSENIEPYLFMIIKGIKSIYVGLYDGKKLTELKVSND